jgi:hypothetical protein
MQPGLPRTRTLQTRIAGVFLLLIVSMQIAGYAVVRNAIDRNARHHGREQLAVGERVLNQLLEEGGSRLTGAAERAANDYLLRDWQPGDLPDDSLFAAPRADGRRG